MGGHLTKDPAANDSKEQWMEKDVCLFIKIHNSIDNKVLGSLIILNFLKT